MSQQESKVSAQSGETRGTALMIGNFDGCHLGHQRLAAATIALGRELGLTTLALTFRPRPDLFFSGRHDDPGSRLLTAPQQLRAFAELGIDVCVAKKFDKEFSQLTHEEFHDRVLRQELQAAAIIVGADFRFGAGRSGDATWLKDRAARDGLRCTIVPPIVSAGSVVSSSRIRTLLRDSGDVRGVAELLGRPWLLEGRVVSGRKLGRTIGFPTINLSDVQQLVPRSGVYAAVAVISGGRFGLRDALVMGLPDGTVGAAVSIGTNPTVDASSSIKIEAHLLESFGPDELYGLNVGIYLLDRVRDEMRFSEVDELRRQIAADVTAVQGLCNVSRST